MTCKTLIIFFSHSCTDADSRGTLPRSDDANESTRSSYSSSYAWTILDNVVIFFLPGARLLSHRPA